MLLLIAVLALGATDRVPVVTQTVCQTLEGQSLETAKKELLLAARREAVERLFATHVTSLTQIEDLDLQKDQIQAVTVGHVRLQGDPTFFNGHNPGELCVSIDAYTTDEDRTAVDHALRALAQTLRRARSRWALEASLDQLGLGARIVAKVVSSPQQALDGARCTWSAEPAGVLRLPPPDGACRVEIAMPDAPLADRGATIPARILVRIERQDILLDELTVRGVVFNRFVVEPVTSASVLAPGTSIAVSIVPQGSQDPLPPGSVCSWDLQGMPLVFAPATEGGCQGTLTLKPENAWSALEGLSYAHGLKSQLPLRLPVLVFHKGNPAGSGLAVVELAYRDLRDAEALIRSFSLQFSEESRAAHKEPARIDDIEMADIDTELTAEGLPPLSDLNEKTLELRLDFERREGALVTHYVGAHPVFLTGPLDRYSGLLQVLYSRGKELEPQRSARGLKTLQDLVGIDHLWVRLRPSSHWVETGPFRLSFDFPRAARAGLEAAWRALSDEDRQRIGCEGFVVGGEADSILWQHRFLPILDEVAVGRGPDSLWRSRRYGSRIEHLFDQKFERVEPPIRATSYIARLTFAGGRQEAFSCTRTGFSQIREGGSYVRLACSTNTEAAPREIEVYLVEEPSTGWIVWFYDPGGGGDLRSLEPAFVRVSTDGGATFQTVKQNYQNRGSVTFAEPASKALVLRFVIAAAGEVEYRGNVDFAAARRAAAKGRGA